MPDQSIYNIKIKHMYNARANGGRDAEISQASAALPSADDYPVGIPYATTAMLLIEVIYDLIRYIGRSFVQRSVYSVPMNSLRQPLHPRSESFQFSRSGKRSGRMTVYSLTCLM